jgi:signal transduction histidine kinase
MTDTPGPSAPAPPGARRRWRVRDGIGDGVVALLVIAAAIAPFPDDGYRPHGPLQIGLALLPAVVVPFRRRWPVAVLATCLATFGVLAVTGALAPGVVLATAVALFGVANRKDRRASIILAAVAVAAVFVLGQAANVGGVFDPRSVQFAVMVAFAAAAGDATRSRREYIQAMTERAERAERTRETEARRRVSEERLRIARDLHDAVAHQIAVISLNAGVASSALETSPHRAQQALGTIRSASRTVLGEIGDLMAMLRRDDDVPLPGQEPQAGLDRLDGLVDQFVAAGLQVTVRREGDLDELAGATSLVAFRVLQEALTNAHKHGSPHRAHVLVEVAPERVRLVVSNPVAASPATDPPDGGYGLIGLRERVAAVRGSVEAGPAPEGWRVTATLPRSNEATS